MRDGDDAKGPTAGTPAGPTISALFAVPGDLATPTGGYAYARRLLQRAETGGVRLRHWPLPGGFPLASAAMIDEAASRLALGPAGWPILVDGLALGALPPRAIAGASGPVVALCHHPLGLETGLAPREAERLVACERAALAAVSGVVATSATTAEILADQFGVPRARIRVARPGTDRPTLHAIPQPAGGRVEILSVGSLTPRKGHDVLLRALGRLWALDWRLTIVGAAADPAREAELRALAAELSLADRVTFAGAETAEALARRYAAADLFVLASRYEGYGMAFTEAMAAGLPVVGTKAGAVPEATLGAALLVPPDDPGALAEALHPLVTARAARSDLAARCREAAARLPRWDETARIVAEALAAVADTPLDRAR